MPTHNQWYYDQNNRPAPTGLVESGPVLHVEISVAAPLADQLTQQGQSIPAAAAGQALIDTGATATAIDESVVTKLGLSPIDTVQLSTAHGEREAGVYACRIRFASQSLPEIDASRATGVNLAGQAVDGTSIIALIGRDVLRECLFVYNGPMGHFSLSV